MDNLNALWKRRRQEGKELAVRREVEFNRLRAERRAHQDAKKNGKMYYSQAFFADALKFALSLGRNK